ncbi:MAG: outer membrane beta-barrel protein [Maribacter sp.]
MKKSLLFVLLIFSTLQLAAQDKKWSLEANYPISVGSDLGNDASGIIDLGIKYRFINLSFANIGFGINASILSQNSNSFDGFGAESTILDVNETHWLFQPKVFSEFKIPGLKKLRPSAGIGVTFINSNFDGQFNGTTFDNTNNDTGFNVNLGLSYDITNFLFLQGQYDFVSYNVSSGQNDNLGFLKFGLGFRF